MIQLKDYKRRWFVEQRQVAVALILLNPGYNSIGLTCLGKKLLVYITEQLGQQLTSSSRTKPAQTFPFFVSTTAALGPLPFISYHTSTPLLSSFGTSLTMRSEDSRRTNGLSSLGISSYRLGTRTATFLRSALSVHLPFFVETASKPLKSRGRKILLRPVTS